MTAEVATKGGLVVVQAISSQLTAATDTLQATGIDTSLYRRIQIVINVGTVTDGAYVPQLKTSATVGGSYAAQVGTYIDGSSVATGLVLGQSFTTYTSAVDERVDVYDVNIGALDNKWLKVNLHESSAGSTGAQIGVTLLCEKITK